MTARPAPGELHAWWLPVAPASRHWHVLDAQERDQLAAFRTAVAANGFASSRAGQRWVLAQYLQVPPRELRLKRRCRDCGRDHGKPAHPASGLAYSVSRTVNYVVVSVAGDGAVGVDVETLRGDGTLLPDDGFEELALTAAERGELRTVSTYAREATLLRYWTRKEATLKLTGDGLASDPSGVDVRGDSGVRIPAGTTGWPSDILLFDLPSPSSTVASVAADRPLRRLLVRHGQAGIAQ